MLLYSKINTVRYIDMFIIPVLGAIVNAGLMYRMISKLIAAQQDEELTSGKIFKICKKYIVLMVITTVLATVVYLIDGYFA